MPGYLNGRCSVLVDQVRKLFGTGSALACSRGFREGKLLSLDLNDDCCPHCKTGPQECQG